MRAAIPSSKFGLPKERKYPMPDASHAADAKSRATEMVNKGKLSPASAAKIRKMANRVLGAILLCACLALPSWAAPNTFQVTIGASATQMSTTHLYCSAWVIQNNAAHSMRFGDSTASSSKGTQLTTGSSYTSQASMNGAQPVPDDLSQWYIAGTQNDVIDVTCKQVNF
jgi:hypothetical protein